MPDKPPFHVTWQLTLDHEHADTLKHALEPETDPEHAQLATDNDRLIAEGDGTVGTCLHTLDDVLACLTGAVNALDVTTEDDA